MNKSFLIAVSGIALLTESALAAPVEPGQFAGSISAGAEFSIHGDVHGGATSSVPLSVVAALRDAGVPPLTLPAAAAGAELRIQSRSFDEIYGDAMNITLQGAYGLEGNREILLGLGYTRAGEGSVEVGTAAVVSGSGATLVEVPVNGTFGDYKSWVVEAGLRQYFGDGAFKPYIAGRLGVAFVNDIRASFSVPALNINTALNNVAFYDSTTVLTGGIDLGVSYDVSDNFSLQVETGIRFAGGLDGNDGTSAVWVLRPSMARDRGRQFLSQSASVGSTRTVIGGAPAREVGPCAPAGFFALNHCGPALHGPVQRDVGDLQTYQVTASQFAVDGEVE